MELEKIKKTLLKDEKFMVEIYEYIKKRERKELDNYIKKSSVAGTTNDGFVERVRKIATSSLE